MKPFNLEHAKAGAPLQLDDGRKADIYKFGINAVETTYNNAGIVTELDGYQWITQWNDAGACQAGTSYYLHMAPLGQCEGRDVYVGDKLQHKEMASYIIATTPNDFSAWVWPKPPKLYPVTHLSRADLSNIYNEYLGHDDMGLLTINAAIRHGIDNGYLVDPAELDRLSAALGITAPTSADLIGAACYAYKRVVKSGNDWLDETSKARADVAKQNKIITDMAAANSKLIKDHAAAQSTADHRGHSLADIAKLVGMSDGYAYRDVPYTVKQVLDARQTMIDHRGDILDEIVLFCPGLGNGKGEFSYNEIPAAIKAREVAIAKAFFYRGIAGEMGSGMPDQWFEDRITKV